jgi:Spy/CpxP family protein refolding chaperone
MKKLITIIISMLVIFILLIPSISIAQPLPQQENNLELEILRFIVSQRWWNNDKVVQLLNLTNEQIEKLDSLYIEYNKNVIKLKAEVQEKRFELSILLEKDDIEVEAVEKSVDMLMEAITTLEKYEIMTRIKVLGILTPEQREKLIEMVKNIFRKKMDNKAEGYM